MSVSYVADTMVFYSNKGY